VQNRQSALIAASDDAILPSLKTYAQG